MTPSRGGVRLRPRLRLRDIPFLPLLLLLHVVFTLSSLLLRLYEALTTSSTLPPRTFVPPKHVALSLPASVPVTTVRGRSRTETQSAAAVRRRKELELERAAVGSVLRAARWAVREGVETVSVHESSGVLYAAKERLRSELSIVPPSPSLSASTAPLGDSDPVESTGTQGLHEVPGDEEDTADGHGVFSITVFPHHTPTSLSDSTDTLHDGLRPLTLRILPPSSSDLVARITRDLVREGHKTSSITQEVLNARIEAAGYTPPDILLIHPLTPQPFWRSLLPRPAPEIAGYPFWPLRVTEI
ncbi:hypothetical protein EHS25_001180 [Saitozyma podzolica]|uniref:ditrans,polycis-polyprenyl diphosphate synthase [(2E,6E)-farnesyldiphosphate specific] n=1 Tax=Saitozyma podzolica TaxID=1890683 RepID=A0A427YHF5_9TREE|nr:hypothetical protein EHS25_001180 [Saitozyma podzolica]